MSFHRFLLVLRARWGVALLIAGLTIVCCVGGTLRAGNVYQATASVMVDASGRSALTKVLTAKDVATPTLMRRFDPSQLPDANAGLANLTYQLALLTSDEVARRAVKNLGVSEVAEINAAFVQETGGQGDINAWFAEKIRGSIQTTLSPRSSVIRVSYYSDNPKLAATFANAIVDAYLNVYAELRDQIQKPKLAVMGRHTDVTRANLDKAWRKLSEFQAAHAILSLNDLLEPTTRQEFIKVRRMRSQVELLERSAITKSDAIARNPGLTPKGSSMNPAIDAALLNWTEAQADLAEQRARLGKDHPNVRRMEASLAERERETAREIDRLAGAARVDAEVGRDISSQARERLDGQIDLALERMPLQVEARALVQAVLNAHALNTIAQENFHAAIAEAVLERYKVTLLDVATAPASRTAPYYSLLLPLILVLALVLSGSIVLVLEFIDPHVRQAASLQSAGLPLLGSIGDSTLEDHPQIAWAHTQGRA